MSVTQAPPKGELVRRASQLIPLLREKALWMDENRCLHEDAVDALAEAGFLKMRVPVRYGGFGSDMRTIIDVISEIGRGDGSTSWTLAMWALSAWTVGLFPDAVQDEVFSTPDVRICGILSPGAIAVPTNGGYIVNGKWSFNTGARQSMWNTNAAVVPTADGGHEPVMILTPIGDLEIIDDWYTSGMKGSGSVSTAATNLFVPQERVLPIGAILQGLSASPQNAAAEIYRAPMLPVASASSVGCVVGMAKAAREAFFARLPERKITYTGYSKQAKAPLTHLQVDAAVMKIDEAEFHAHRLAELVDTKGVQNAPWTVEERVSARADLGAVCRLAKEAVEILATASGGSSIYSDQPIQRIARDVNAVTMHALMHPDTNAELHGRILCGLEPDTLYI